MVSGTLVHDRELGIKVLDNLSNLAASVEFTDANFETEISQVQLAGLVNNVSLEESSIAARTFNDCFVAEWNAFCSDTISCIAQAVAPLEIAAAIALSCAFE